MAQERIQHRMSLLTLLPSEQNKIETKTKSTFLLHLNCARVLKNLPSLAWGWVGGWGVVLITQIAKLIPWWVGEGTFSTYTERHWEDILFHRDWDKEAVQIL